MNRNRVQYYYLTNKYSSAQSSTENTLKRSTDGYSVSQNLTKLKFFNAKILENTKKYLQVLENSKKLKNSHTSLDNLV